MSLDPNAADASASDRPIPTLSLSHQDELLRDRLIDDLVAQSTRMDEAVTAGSTPTRWTAPRVRGPALSGQPGVHAGPRDPGPPSGEGGRGPCRRRHPLRLDCRREQRDAPDLLTREYQCPATVGDWLARQPDGGLAAGWLGVAADFQLYLYRTARQTFDQAVAVHEALRAASRQHAADRWVLDVMVEPMNRLGLYVGLLKDWLPAVCESTAPKTRADALDRTGQQYFYIGDYRTALCYYLDALAIQQQSLIHKARGELGRALELFRCALAIRQEIGDRAGEGQTLSNIGLIHQARGEPWVGSSHASSPERA